MKQMNLHTEHRQRMKKRFRAADESHSVEETFSEHELLELLLFYAQPRVNTNETAHRLLQQFGSLHNVIQAPETALMHVKGVGENAATLIRLLSTLFRMSLISNSNTPTSFRMTGIADLVPYIQRMYYMETAEEHVFLMLFEADGTHRKTIRIADGTNTGATVDIPKCLLAAMQYGASSAVLVHNHPSSAEPSEEDRALTQQLCTAFKYAGMTIMDHLILTDDSCYSIMSNTVYKPSMML